VLRRFAVAGLVLVAALASATASGGDARDDTAWLQAKLDAGGTLALPALPNGECYATRGLWVSRDDTRIVSNGACIVGLGPGQVRLRSTDGDPIAAEAVFYVSRSSPFDPSPVRVSISGVRIRVPAGVELYGISLMAHQASVHGVEVAGSPIDALYLGGRANDGFAGRVSVTDSRFLGGRRNVISIVGGIDVRIVGNESAAPTTRTRPPRDARGVTRPRGSTSSPAAAARRRSASGSQTTSSPTTRAQASCSR